MTWNYLVCVHVVEAGPTNLAEGLCMGGKEIYYGKFRVWVWATGRKVILFNEMGKTKTVWFSF